MTDSRIITITLFLAGIVPFTLLGGWGGRATIDPAVVGGVPGAGRLRAASVARSSA